MKTEKLYSLYLQIDYLPSTLKRLSLGSYFNQPLGNLPPSLDELYLDGTLTHPIDLPDSITSLIFDGAFDHPINHLPASLMYLKLSVMFDQPLSNLPTKLQHLHVGESYSHSLPDLPKGLKTLDLGANFVGPIVNPPAITSLHTGSQLRDFSWLPASLTYLDIRNEDTEDLDAEFLPKYLPNITTFSSVPASNIDYSKFKMPNLTEFNCGIGSFDIFPTPKGLRTYNFPILRKFSLAECYNARPEQVWCC